MQQPVIDVLSKTQKMYWNVGRVICVDECMVLLKSGLISFIQYMMLKPIKHGLKIFALCCSKSGYLFAFEVYTGKDNTSEGSAYETRFPVPLPGQPESLQVPPPPPSQHPSKALPMKKG
jgi:hypothetical protein